MNWHLPHGCQICSLIKVESFSLHQMDSTAKLPTDCCTCKCQSVSFAMKSGSITYNKLPMYVVCMYLVSVT